MRSTTRNLFDDTPEKRTHHAPKLNSDALRCNQVFEQLTQEGDNGASADEVASVLQLSRGQVGPALSELHDWGKVRKSEARRQTPSGGFATVWIAVKEKH